MKKIDRIYFPRNIPNRHWYVIQFQCVRGKNGEPLRWEVNVFDSQAAESESIKDAVGALTDVLEYALMSASEQDQSNADLHLKLKVLKSVTTVKNNKNVVPEQDDATSCGIYSVLNILLYGLGIEVTKETYTAFSGEVHLRWAFFAVLYNARTSGRDALYSNVSYEIRGFDSDTRVPEVDDLRAADLLGVSGERVPPDSIIQDTTEGTVAFNRRYQSERHPLK
jgi:hypothetical protein